MDISIILWKIHWKTTSLNEEMHFIRIQDLYDPFNSAITPVTKETDCRTLEQDEATKNRLTHGWMSHHWDSKELMYLNLDFLLYAAVYLGHPTSHLRTEVAKFHSFMLLSFLEVRDLNFPAFLFSWKWYIEYLLNKHNHCWNWSSRWEENDCWKRAEQEQPTHKKKHRPRQ